MRDLNNDSTLASPMQQYDQFMRDIIITNRDLLQSIPGFETSRYIDT